MERADTSLEFELQAANRLETAGRLGEAAALYEQLQQRFPDAAEVYRRYGRLKIQDGDSAGALTLLDKARSLAPETPEISIDLAEALMAAGERQGAETEVERAIDLAPENGDYRVKRALLYLERGERDAAIACCSAALEHAPQTKGAQQILGTLHWQGGELEAAAAALQAARQAEPPAADPNGLLALALFALGRPREIAGLTRCLSDSQLYIEIVVQAIYTWEAGRFEYCRQILERANAVHAHVADANRTLVFRPLHRILAALLDFGITNSKLYEQEATAPIVVVGDNQALSAAHLPVLLDGEVHRMRSAFVNVGKAWHLAKPENNPTRAAVVAVLDRLPAGTKVAFSFGELDCRYRDSLISHLKAHPTLDRAASVAALVAAYLDRVQELTAARGLAPLVVVPPAPNVKLRKIASTDRGLFADVTRGFCEGLRSAAKARGIPAIDLYGATLKTPRDGPQEDAASPEATGLEAKDELFIDGNHVLPSAYLAAFERL